MTTYELLAQIDLLINGSESSRYVFAIVSEFPYLPKPEREPSEGGRILEWIRETYFTERSVDPLERIDPKNFFLAMNAFESSLSSLTLMLPAQETDIRDLVNDFATEYEQWLRDRRRSPRALQRMIEIASKIRRQREKWSWLKAIIEVNLADSSSPSDAESSLSLLLVAESDLPRFIEKLTALKFIYEEVSELLKVSPKKEPLRIARIESGSLWAKLFGEIRVVTLMISLIESTVRYLYRNFTDEGQLTVLPKSLETISLTLDLEKKLRDAGMETSEMKDNIQKSSILISKRLNTLLAGEPRIEINGHRHSVGSELESRYLDQSKRLLIEDKIGDDA